uniref:Uncharacterized protein n=1 Tax=Ixodes ricinus TaxID=34613 RepID=A0A6B0UHP7_IXORI
MVWNCLGNVFLLGVFYVCYLLRAYKLPWGCPGSVTAEKQTDVALLILSRGGDWRCFPLRSALKLLSVFLFFFSNICWHGALGLFCGLCSRCCVWCKRYVQGSG